MKNQVITSQKSLVKKIINSLEKGLKNLLNHLTHYGTEMGHVMRS